MDSVQTLTVTGKFENLSLIGAFVTRAAQAAGLDERAVYAVEMAVDEACSNIIEHAYGGEGRGDIECACHIDETGLTITLRDHGRPFDPQSVPQPNLQTNIEEREAGGLGIYLMHQLMDEVRFDFTSDEGNLLTMMKRRSFSE